MLQDFDRQRQENNIHVQVLSGMMSMVQKYKRKVLILTNMLLPSAETEWFCR
jgi:hypothetical protein